MYNKKSKHVRLYILRRLIRNGKEFKYVAPFHRFYKIKRMIYKLKKIA